MGTHVAHRPHRNMQGVYGTQISDTPWEVGISSNQRYTNIDKEVPVLKVKGMRRWCPAVSISSCLSLISILRGNVPGFAGLTSVCVTGGKSRRFSFFSFRNLVGLGTLVWMCLISESAVDIITQFLPTGWQASFQKDMPFSTLSFSFCFYVCITNSKHPLLHYLLHFF